MERLIRLGGAAILLACIVGLPVVARAQQVSRPPRFDLATSNSYFSGVVTRGPDAGQRVEGLLALTANAGTLTMGTGATAPVTSGVTSSGVTLTVTLPHGILDGQMTSSQRYDVAGTFTGPSPGDQGFWTALTAVTMLNLAVTGKVSSGPHRGSAVLIGDLVAYAAHDGTLFGTYTDNSRAGPGVVAKVYPVHGTYVHDILTASMVFDAKHTFALIGHAGRFFGLARVAGPMIGPSGRDVGTWAGLTQQ
jgi:hypothetical protein